MGQLHLAAAGHLDPWVGDHLACETNSHQRDICAFVSGVCVPAQLDYGRPVALRNFSDHRTDVPALRVFYDYGSEDDGEVDDVAMHRGVYRGVCRDVVASQSRGLRTAVRALPCWTNSDADRDLVGVTAGESRLRVFLAKAQR